MNAARSAFVALVVAPLLCCAPSVARACACCSDEGQYLTEHGKPSDLQLAEMGHMKFAPTAQLYVGPGDKENVKGLRAPSYDYSLEASFDSQAAEWKLSFRDADGKTGVLFLPMKAAKMSGLKIDIHSGQKSAGGGPSLYKE